jgi:hypothetical protein
VKGASKPPGLDLNFNQGSLQCIAPCQIKVPADQRIDYGLTGNDIKYKVDLGPNYFNYTSAYSRQADTTPISPAVASNLFSGLPAGTQIATRAFSIGPTNFGTMMIGSPAAQPTTNWWTKYYNTASAWDPAGGLDLMTDDCRTKLPAAYVPGEPWPATALGHDLPEATVRLGGKHRGHG